MHRDATPLMRCTLHAIMETPASFIGFSENVDIATTFADGDVEEVADEHEDAACDEEHPAPDSEDDPAEATIDEEGSPPIEHEPVSEIMLGVLAKNRLGTWFACQRARFPLWAFFCPADDSLTWEEKAKCTTIECLICYAQR